MSKKLSMGIALALMASMPNSIGSAHSVGSCERKEPWQGRGKRKRPKAR